MPCYQKAVRLSYKHGLYRQNYYGCIYSEKERFLRKAASKAA
ncbi:MAG: epoxyqueuosine reductase QueH [Deltaproteobacteria bacterium]|nr:epoxyqueuosine reductase QueH [Deltaproteobacteria bacterium]